MDKKKSFLGAIFIRIIAFIMFMMGLYLAIMGGYLVFNNGSAYYVITGLISILSAFLLWRVNILGVWLYFCLLIATIIWAVWEKGMDFWGFFPRSFVILVMTCLVFLFFPLARRWSTARTLRKFFWPIGCMIGIFSAVIFNNLFTVHYLVYDRNATSGKSALAISDNGEWTHYARNGAGRRFASFNQINLGNVHDLDVAWSFQVGDIVGQQSDNQDSPLQIGDTVYACSPNGIVFALNADTGEKRWSFDPKGSLPLVQRCRSLGYADLDKNTIALPATSSDTENSALIEVVSDTVCRQRIIFSTIDSRLIAVDTKTGEKCLSFGKNGEINLRESMGNVDLSYYTQTSLPTIIENGIIITAGRVGEQMPLGIVRAFNIVDGSLIWIWKRSNPAISKEPPIDEIDTRGSSYSWTTPVYDKKLGLVYLPIGNEILNYWDGQRTKEVDEYNSSLVAFDYHTGKEKWKFQTTHHDVSGFAIPAQPVLYDVLDENGIRIPAVIQVTKRGEIFMLDRRNGVPITAVEEKPVSQTGVAEGNYVSPTQPYSVGMPQIRYPEFKESDMWGVTMFDQLLCRIDFKQMDYKGDFTPISVKKSIQYPSNLSRMNWGGVAIDESKGYLIINDVRFAKVSQLIPDSVQTGTPLSVTSNDFLSVLGIPCNAPPYGTLTAVDLASHKIVWQVPLGTIIDPSSVSSKIGMPIEVGLPNLGGALLTGGNLIFYSGKQDYYLRAFNSNTGQEVWKSRLPAGGQTTPVTYLSSKTGQQYIILTISGGGGQSNGGAYIIAYRLKEKK